MIGYGVDSFGYITHLASLAKERFDNLPKIEQERIIKERAEREEKKRIKILLQAGKCPDCNSKLVRGKKEKDQGYKRKLICLKCENIYYR